MKHHFLNVFLVLTFSVFVLSACTKNPSNEINLAGKTMGTTYSVKYYPDSASENISQNTLQAEIDQRLLEINQLMSTYIPDSELSLLNKAPALQPITLNEETAGLIRRAGELGQLSSGALDITVGPIVNLWGFGPDKRPDVVPSDEQVARAREFVGLDKFVLDGNTLTKLHDSVYIDLSTIAKGYAVDELARILESYNIDDYLVEIGGEMRLSGQKEQGQDWRVAIEKPITNERAVQRIITIGDNAIATSGDYRNYFEEDGVRFSHLIDPNTAYPIQHNLVAVSVIAETSTDADGLATALIVMGADEGMALAEEQDIAAIFITREGTEFKEYRSTAFERRVKVIQ